MRKLVTTTALLLIAPLALVPASAFHANDLPVAYSATTPGAAAYGLSFTATGPFALDLEAHGPVASSQLSGALFFLDAAGNVLFGFAFTGHLSPDRLIVTPTGTAGDAANLPAGVEIVTRAEGDADALVFGLGMNGGSGTYRLATWVGGGASTQFSVRGAVTGLAVNAGEAHVLGDAEIASGSPNVQAQSTPGGLATAGVKVMRDASAAVDADATVYGFWGASDFKLACQFRVGACLWGSTVTYTCTALTGVNCDTTSLSWSGPTGGGSGGTLYALLGAPAGAYEFTVDSKIDLYGPNVYDPVTGTWVLAGEDFSYLTIGVVNVP